MRSIFHWAVIGIFIVLGFWMLMISGELFRAHMPTFLFLWLFLPVAAYWVSTKRVRSVCSVFVLEITRNGLVAAVAFISFLSFAHYDRIRDGIGQRFVAGYAVSHHEDTDDYSGQAFGYSEASTADWYSQFGLWLFEWTFLAASLGLPVITWQIANSAVDKVRRESTDDVVQ